MPIDRDSIESNEREVYRFMKAHRGQAYTKKELKEELDIDRVGSMYDYTTFHPFRWKREYHDGQDYYSLVVNWFALFLYAVVGLLVVVMTWLAIHHPEVLFTTCL